MNRFKQLDLQSLVCLEALVTARSVTRAAERLNMSQPGMSNALARLRKALRDPLLISTSHGMEPTPRGIEVAEAVRKGLQFFDAVLCDQAPFDSATASATVTIAAADYAGLRIIPRMMERMTRQAPGIRLELRLPDPKHVREWLEAGECDLFIGHYPNPQQRLLTSMLFDEPLVCIARRGHPDIHGHMSLERYAGAGHVVFGSPFSPTSTLEAAVEEALAKIGVERRIFMRVASVTLPAHIVAETNLIATIGKGLAEHHAKALPIEIFPLPFAATALTMRMVWHDRTHQSGLHIWVRQLIREVTA